MKLFVTLKFSIAAIVLSFACACTQKEEPDQPQSGTGGIPETLENEVVDILGRDWKSLVDTLEFFADDMLRKGKFEGWGSDSVYYALKGARHKDTVSLTFTIQDSLWLSLNACNFLGHVEVYACDVDFSYDRLDDSTRFTVQNISATVPDVWPIPDDAVMPVTYCQVGVGYIKFLYLENVDYTTDRYPVMYYYDDTRSFGFYESIDLLSIPDISDYLIGSIE